MKVEEGRSVESEKDDTSNEIVPEKPAEPEELHVKVEANIQERVPYQL